MTEITVNIACEVNQKLVRMLEQRAAVGLKKYGVTVADNPLPPEAWIDHAIEEALDFAVYLMKLRGDMLKGRDILKNKKCLHSYGPADGAGYAWCKKCGESL